MSSESLFNKLWVIESLPEGDLKTGKNLVDNQLATEKKGQTYTLDRPDGYDIHPSFLLLSAA